MIATRYPTYQKKSCRILVVFLLITKCNKENRRRVKVPVGDLARKLCEMGWTLRICFKDCLFPLLTTMKPTTN
jgi:hypothetical protein